MFVPIVLWPLHVPPSRDWAQPFSDALLDARLSRQETAAALGISEQQLSRALADVPGANVHLRRIMAGLPARFHQHFAVRLLLRYGLPREYAAGVRIALGLVLGGAAAKRMARMGLEDSATATSDRPARAPASTRLTGTA